jgi:hypothetical protein
VNRKPHPKKETTDLAFESKLKINGNALHVELDGEIVILGLETEQYYGLTDVGARIWALMQENSTLGEMHQTLLDEYDVPPGVLWQDMLSVISELVEARLIALD